ncbi:MAG TPA: GDSL-type esterase/lipase family protein [Chitinophagales bacterium]|nr:GDSL-type esterase/lipase family protein [Chitinophagales bacterium]
MRREKLMRITLSGWKMLFMVCAGILNVKDTVAQTLLEVPTYSFIDQSKNHLVNDTALKNFFQKMDELKKGARNQVVIVQMGDSHIQADFFSSVLRENFQRQFGNAGRGLIFPYKVAGTNGPWNYHASSFSKWQSKRNVFPADSLPIGVCGITIKTKEPLASINFSIADDTELNYSFNKITLFADKSCNSFDYAIRNPDHKIVGFINSADNSADSVYTSVQLADTLHEFSLQTVKTDSSRLYGMIYGLSLENSQPGVLYHTLGVNGAMFFHYNVSKYFVEQLSSLHPDLIIISLGTNEAYSKDYTSENLKSQMNELITALKERNPQANFLLTSPPDGYRYHRYKNPSVAKAVETERKYALEHDLAFWDFYHLMGGYGSIYRWKQNGLAQHDRLHLTKQGYFIEGKMLFNAMMEAYLNRKTEN